MKTPTDTTREIAKLKNLIFRMALMIDGYHLAEFDYEGKAILEEVDAVALDTLPVGKVQAKRERPKLRLVN